MPFHSAYNSSWISPIYRFEGDGKDFCNKTCFYDCVQGTCGGPPLYQCDCNIGWTNASCDVDCGCYNHSTCVNGTGICDLCQHMTHGKVWWTAKINFVYFVYIYDENTVCKKTNMSDTTTLLSLGSYESEFVFFLKVIFFFFGNV